MAPALFAALLAAGCDPERPANGAWAPIAPWPGPKWYFAQAVWTGGEAVVLGAAHEYEPGLLCCPDEYPVDAGAAAYDPGTDRWRPVAATPFRLSGTSIAALDGEVYAYVNDTGTAYGVSASEGLWTYSPTADGWRPLPAAPRVGGSAPRGGLVAAGDRLVLSAGAREGPRVDLAYDPSARTWGRLPGRPFPGAPDEDVVGLPDGRLVVVAPTPFPAGADPLGPGVDLPPRYWRAAVLDPGARKWRVLPPSPVAVGQGPRQGRWVAAAGLVVNLADAARPLWGTSGPATAAPTGGILDPVAGTWSLLPERPRSDPADRAGEAVSWLNAWGGDVVVQDGWAYDARRRTWAEPGPVPSAPDGLTLPAVVWAGDRLLAWDYARFGAPDGREGGHVFDNVGWAWRPDGDGR